MKTFCRNNERRDLLGVCIGHDSIGILQFSFDEGFDCVFELSIVETTLIVAGGDDSLSNLIDLENIP